MRPDIGIMIGVYILLRCCEFIGSAEMRLFLEVRMGGGPNPVHRMFPGDALFIVNLALSGSHQPTIPPLPRFP